MEFSVISVGCFAILTALLSPGDVWEGHSLSSTHHPTTDTSHSPESPAPHWWQWASSAAGVHDGFWSNQKVSSFYTLYKNLLYVFDSIENAVCFGNGKENLYYLIIMIFFTKNRLDNVHV